MTTYNLPKDLPVTYGWWVQKYSVGDKRFSKYIIHKSKHGSFFAYTMVNSLHLPENVREVLDSKDSVAREMMSAIIVEHLKNISNKDAYIHKIQNK